MDFEYSCGTTQHTLCVSKVHTHMVPELLGLERFLSLWRVFFYHVCEVSAVLDFQGIETLLHRLYRVLGRGGSPYLHLSSPFYSMALPLKKKKTQPNSAIIFWPSYAVHHHGVKGNGITDSKTLHGVSF